MNSLILSRKEIRKLQEFIDKNKLKTLPPTNEYEKIRLKDGRIQLILYNTGKLVFNNSEESSEILKSILERETDFDLYLGSDEAGKGEWYGPLVVVATALNPEEIFKLRMLGVKDSKTMKTPKIMETAQRILKLKITHQTMLLTPETYNKLYKNFKSEGKTLNDLLAWAHSRVIKDLISRIEFKKAYLVIDKFDQKKMDFQINKLDLSNVDVVQMSGGESETPVAAASIIAKYQFEREVDRLSKKYGIDLKKIGSEIDVEIVGQVAKEHFANVQKILR
jgi:ribonuclease HIII